MKHLYRRPYRLSVQHLLIITVLSISGYLWVSQQQQPDYMKQMLAATNLTEQGFQVIRDFKQQQGISFDAQDPSGILGTWRSTSVTSIVGNKEAKLLSTDPQFAALTVSWLKQLQLEAGDKIAISLSGSFPALNLAVLAACEILNIEPVIIASLTASQWGANHPNALWLDMHQQLIEQNIIRHYPVALSYGAANDNADNLTAEGLIALEAALARNPYSQLIYNESLADNILQKWQVYQQTHAHKPIKAMINIGGGIASIGSNFDKKHRFLAGINTELPENLTGQGLLSLALTKQIPVLNFSQIEKIYDEYQLAKHLESPIYSNQKYQQLKAWVMLALIISTLCYAAFREKHQQSLL